MIRSQTEKIPPQPVTCGRVGGGGVGSGSDGRRECAAAARQVTFSASGDFRFDSRAAARRQSEFPTRSLVAAGRTTSVIGGAII